MEEIDASNIACPECGRIVHVHYLTPDTALLDLMFHFMSMHETLSPLDLLDNIEIETSQGLIPNGV